MPRIRWTAFVIALLSPIASLTAQRPDTLSRIAGITIERQNIFEDSVNAGFVGRLANRLHIVSHAGVIRRELLFRVGDTYDSTRFAETERNIRLLGVFHVVRIDTTRTDSGLVVRVRTQDGWSTRPELSGRLTGGEKEYTVSLIEDNLLGSATSLEARFRKQPDRTTTIFAFRQPRLFGKFATSLQFLNRSDGNVLSGYVRRPFYSLATRSSAEIAFDNRQERILVFRDGREVPRDTVQRRFSLGRVSYGKALATPPQGYLRASVFAQVYRDDFISQALYDVTGGFPARSVRAAVGAILEQRHGHYIKVRGFQSLGREEDIDLSRIVRVSLTVAPAFFGYQRNGIAPAIAMHAGARLPAGFATVDAGISGLLTRDGIDSGRVRLSVTTVLTPVPRHQFVLHAEGGAAHNPLPGAEFDLGFAFGPRAFRLHSFTGDRQYFFTGEYRYLISPELFKLVGVAAAGFIDHGGAAWHGSPMRSGTDAGIGLRFGVTRANDQTVNRFDLARRFPTDRQQGEWIVVIGKGFVF